MQETVNKILYSFPRHPHLRMAIVALTMLGDEKLLASGDVEEFEKWVYAHPSLHNDLDNCRHFLQAYCPLRFDHTKRSRNWENVAEKFPEAAHLLTQALKEANKPCLVLDFAAYHRLGASRPGKKARAALEVAEKVLSAFATEAGYLLIGAEDSRASTASRFSFAPTLCVTRTYSLFATLDAAFDVSTKLAEVLEASGRTIALTEDTGDRVGAIGGVNEVGIVFPVHAMDYDQNSMAEEMEFLAKAIFKGEVNALLP